MEAQFDKDLLSTMPDAVLDAADRTVTQQARWLLGGTSVQWKRQMTLPVTVRPWDKPRAEGFRDRLEHIWVMPNPEWAWGTRHGRLPGGRDVWVGTWGLYDWRVECPKQKKQHLAKLGGKRKRVLFEELEVWWDWNVDWEWGRGWETRLEGETGTRSRRILLSF